MASTSSSDFWAVTTYFNPGGSENRRRNFDHFCRFLGIPLLVIETNPTGEPTIGQNLNGRVICLQGNPHLWQKECLLNLAVERLPPHVQYVAWLDCDVVLEQADWVDRARKILATRGGVLQLFSEARQICPRQDVENASREKLFSLPTTDYSQSFAMAHRRGLTESKARFSTLVDTWTGDAVPEIPLESTRPQTGFAWAARRADLRTWGFYPYFVAGGGDRAFCFAAINRPDIYLSERQLTPAHERHYRQWARELDRHLQGNVLCLDGELRHFWHGTTQNRQYKSRFNILLEHHYDPERDVVMDAGGTLRWRDEQGPLARKIRDYFHNRREDA